MRSLAVVEERSFFFHCWCREREVTRDGELFAEIRYESASVIRTWRWVFYHRSSWILFLHKILCASYLWHGVEFHFDWPTFDSFQGWKWSSQNPFSLGIRPRKRCGYRRVSIFHEELSFCPFWLQVFWCSRSITLFEEIWWTEII